MSQLGGRKEEGRLSEKLRERKTFPLSPLVKEKYGG